MRKILIALILAVVAFSPAHAAGIEEYDTTASNNTSLFPEGMNPSDVNDNLRQVQADIREWYETPQWRDLNDSPTFVSSDTFTFSSDLTSTYVENMRLKIVGTGAMGTVYGTIDSSTFGGGVNTIEVTLDSGSLDNTISEIHAGIDPTNDPIPFSSLSDIDSSFITDQSDVAFTSADTLVYADSSDSDNLKKDTIQGILDLVWPVGSIHVNITCTDPGDQFGGTWTAFGAGRMMVGKDSGDVDFDTEEETGGAKTHTLTTDEIPSHSHDYEFSANSGGTNSPQVSGVAGTGSNSRATTNTGGGSAHNNVPPYIVVCMFKRTG